jgi:shikimate dehydrogenase
VTVTGRSVLAGVIGYPVSQSLSPRLHSYWLREYEIDGAYVALPVAREAFAVALAGLRATGFAGANVTVPHKEAAFALASRHDRAATLSGAVNLLVFHGDHMEGRNSDVGGLAASLDDSLGHERLRAEVVTILGAGGAVRSAVLALDSLGAGEIRIVARKSERAGNLALELKSAVAAKLCAYAWHDWPAAAAGTALLVNATSAGMQAESPLSLALDVLPQNAAVCDIVYNPLNTALLMAARARGHQIVDGLGMLMHQAVPAFAAFYGVTPTITPGLRSELERALANGG